MFEINKQGSTRIVILTKNYAIKVPSLYSFKHFLIGLLANIQEVEFGCSEFKCLAPIIKGNRYGIFVIQQRLKPIKHKGLFWVEHKKLVIDSKIPDMHLSDLKPENYGFNNGKLQRVDYGN